MTTEKAQANAESLALPAAHTRGGHGFEETLAARRSVRAFQEARVALTEIAQLLWAGQGITSREDGLRTAPSAGALYPLELYLVAGRVEGLAAGVYRYLAAEHRLAALASGDLRQPLAAAAHDQECVRQAALVLVFTAVERRTTRKYGERGRRYVHMEAGHAAQNVFLQATALDLGAVMVGAFDDAAVARALQLPADESPMCLMPIGWPERS